MVATGVAETAALASAAAGGVPVSGRLAFLSVARPCERGAAIDPSVGDLQLCGICEIMCYRCLSDSNLHLWFIFGVVVR